MRGGPGFPPLPEIPMIDEPVPDLTTRLRTGLWAGFATAWKLVRVTFPIYVGMELLKRTSLLPLLGEFFAPGMGWFGLPGEAALAFLAGGLINLYAAIAVLVPLSLSPSQVTLCGLMMGIAHNLVLEGAVLSSTGTRGGILTACRLLLAVAAGLIVSVAYRAAAS